MSEDLPYNDMCHIVRNSALSILHVCLQARRKETPWDAIFEIEKVANDLNRSMEWFQKRWIELKEEKDNA